MIAFLFGGGIFTWLFPLSILAAIGLNFLFAGRLGTDKRMLGSAAVLSLLILGVSLFISGWYFDLSWDGQWYQQAAVYDLAGHWNPILQPMETPGKTEQLSILHFPKSSWYFGAAVLRSSGSVEMGKAYNLMLLVTASGVVCSLCRDLGMKAWRSVMLTVLVVLNPVVWSELTSYLNDGDLYLLLVIYLAAAISWLRDPRPAFSSIAVMASICLVNIKFTGLVFFMVCSFFLFIYTLIRKRGRIGAFVLVHVMAGVTAVCVFGYNPYVTNMLHRGNPLYPLMGSGKFPSVYDKGGDDNEKYETPLNMKGKSLPIRLLYANFSRPGNAPYNGEDSAQWAYPSLTGSPSWRAYEYHETRLGGFGPYFGVLLVLWMVVLPILLMTMRTVRLPVLLFLGGLCCCLCLSKHFWWPRFFPMLWMAPLVPLFLCWMGRPNGRIGPIGEKADRRVMAAGWLLAGMICWLLAGVICINGCIVAYVHMRWETASSMHLRAQLQQLRDSKRPVVIDYGWFERSMAEKLNHWNIHFTAGSVKGTDSGAHKLTSVVEGYPNQVWYRQTMDGHP